MVEEKMESIIMGYTGIIGHIMGYIGIIGHITGYIGIIGQILGLYQIVFLNTPVEFDPTLSDRAQSPIP